MRKFIAVAALGAAVVGGTAHAAITVYTSQSSYLAAISNPGTDTYEELPYFTAYNTPQTLTAGSYGYTAAATAGALLVVGETDDNWLSTALPTDPITLNAFTGGVFGVGGFFFGNDASGTFTDVDSISVTVTDASSLSTQRIDNPTRTSFLGFVSTTGIQTVVVSPPVAANAYPTINDLILGGRPGAAAPAVPEPASWAMMVAGFALVGAALRRRARATFAVA